VLARTDVYADDHHWGDAPIDLEAHDLPALKARYLIGALPRRGRVLEIGCGSGRLLHTIAASRPDLELHGCDIRPLRRTSVQFEFTLVQPDADTLPYDRDSFDAVVLYDVLEHLFEPSSMVEHARDVLPPGGTLVSFTPLEGQRRSMYRFYRRAIRDDLYVRTKEHVQAYSESTLRSLVEPHFSIVDHEYAYHPLGQLMDATLFAALEIPALRARFWDSNPFYAEGAADDPDISTTSLFGRALKAANALAFHESRLLRRSSVGSAGILFTARAR